MSASCESILEDYVKSSNFLNYPYVKQPEWPLLRSISNRYYKDALDQLKYEGIKFSEIQQGCMQSPSIHKLTFKRYFFIREEDKDQAYEILVDPENPSLTKVHNVHQVSQYEG